MTFDDYQHLAARTMPTGRKEGDNAAMLLLGLAGEVGEIIEIGKKALYHDHPVDSLKNRAEIGDVLWYLANYAALCGYSLDDIAAENIAKLQARYPNGFSEQDSRERQDGVIASWRPAQELRP